MAKNFFLSFHIKKESEIKMPINIHRINSKLNYIKPECKIGKAEEIGLDLKKVMQSDIAKNIKKGELINSGTFADVFTLEGWEKSYVVRIERDAENNEFHPNKLKPAAKNINNEVFASENKAVSILKRITGIPLYEKFWTLDKASPLSTFKETFKMLRELPDKVFLRYIDDILKIKEAGYHTDTYNPNNYLYDAENERINIIDILKNYKKEHSLEMEEFFPLLNAKKYLGIVYNMNLEERKQLVKDTKSFIDRMIKLAKEKGFDIKMEELDYLKKQDFVVNVYHEDPFVYKLGRKK